jgi:hypothetical protein
VLVWLRQEISTLAHRTRTDGTPGWFLGVVWPASCPVTTGPVRARLNRLKFRNRLACLVREWAPALSEYLVVRHAVAKFHKRPSPSSESTYPVQIWRFKAHLAGSRPVEHKNVFRFTSASLFHALIRQRSANQAFAGSNSHTVDTFIATSTSNKVAVLRTLPEMPRSASETTGCWSANESRRSLTP